MFVSLHSHTRHNVLSKVKRLVDRLARGDHVNMLEKFVPILRRKAAVLITSNHPIKRSRSGSDQSSRRGARTPNNKISSPVSNFLLSPKRRSFSQLSYNSPPLSQSTTGIYQLIAVVMCVQ